ncbi:MAG: iron oxidase [Betaproteobacteria bacterium]|nr:iron oxidase [Betaproteobacteria bacterium]
MSESDARRRQLIKALLALGMGLALPDAWPAMAGTGGKALGVAGHKVSQAAAKYRATPNGSEFCADCANFISPNACRKVQGTISPSGWCTLWQKKA